MFQFSATAQPHAMIARHKHGCDHEQVWLDGTPTRLQSGSARQGKHCRL